MAKYIDNSRLKWLKDELAELRGQGVLDESTEKNILEYYAAEEAAPVCESPSVPSVPEGAEKPKTDRAAAAGHGGKQFYILYVLVLLGVLSVGCGIILLFAYNWDMLSVFQRVVVAFIPVLLGASCGVYAIVKEKDARWREASAFITTTGFAVLTALISQIYHTGGTLEDFMRLLTAVSLPLIYIFRSQLLCAVYCLWLYNFINWGRWDFEGSFFNMPLLCYIAGITPFILYYLLYRRPYDLKTAWMRYIVLIPMVCLLIEGRNFGSWEMSVAASGAFLLAAGFYLNDIGEKGWKNPWLVLGWVTVTVMMAIASSSRRFWIHFMAFGDQFIPGFSDETPPRFMLLYGHLMGFWIFPFALGVYAAIRRRTELKLIIMVFPLFLFLVRLFKLPLPVALWGMNGYFLLIAVALLRNGLRSQGLLAVNAGLLQLAILVHLRFFDARVGILTRAVAFIAIGIAFIAANIYLGRAFKRWKEPAAVEEKVSDDEK